MVMDMVVHLWVYVITLISLTYNNSHRKQSQIDGDQTYFEPRKLLGE